MCTIKQLLMKLKIFVRGTCKAIHFSGGGFTVVVCTFPKHRITLQAFVRIVSSFHEHLFHRIFHNGCIRIWLSLNCDWLNH